jgi:hypothetical protein
MIRIALALMLVWVQVAAAQSVRVRDDVVRLPRLSVDPTAEHIYGVRYTATGALGNSVKPIAIRGFDADNNERFRMPLSNNYGTFTLEPTPGGSVGRIEVFSKRGTVQIEIEVEVRGKDEIDVGHVELVEGGFPDDPPVRGAAYLDWIDSLKPSRDHARAMGFPEQKLRPDAKTLDDDTKAFLELPLQQLITLAPTHRPFSGGFGPWHTIGHEWRDSKDLKWDPRNPNELRTESGELFEPRKRFGLTGEQTVVGINGVSHQYAYYDPPEDQWEQVVNDKQKKGNWKSFNPPHARVYVDNIMADVRCRAILKAARDLAQFSSSTGDRDAGVRAALLYYSLGKAMPNWPVYGNNFGSDHWQFFPPDAYETWFAFPIVSWAPPSFGFLKDLTSDFSLISGSDEIWKDASKITGDDAWTQTCDGMLLSFSRYSIRMDAFHRNNPWTFFHNTIGPQIEIYMRVGRLVGEPELMHYSIRKTDLSMRYTFMPDGMFPESTSYHNMMIHGLGLAMWFNEGYTDPPGYTSRLTGRRYDNFVAGEQMVMFGRALRVGNRLKFPDGSDTTIHDTWAGNWREPQKLDRDALSDLLPDFGHAILGRGRDLQGFEAHLHYSGYYNHAHADALAFTLWAYGDELVPDLGYTHMGPSLTATPSHNLVVVDQRDQRRGGSVGDLLNWHVSPGGVQFAQADATQDPYPNLQRYRRSIVHLPMGETRDLVLDVFEVAGGDTHDWMANGCADYPQQVDTDLKFTGKLDTLGDGPLVTDPQDPALGARNGVSPVYRMFRNLRTAGNTKPWQVTMSPGPVASKDAVGASRRAMFTGPRPSLRLRYLAPLDGQVILGQVPQHRFPNELPNGGVARSTWNDRLMPKIIVRREGKNLDSTFVALWEPYMSQAWIERAKTLADMPAEQGAAVLIEGAGGRAVVAYQKPGKAKLIDVEGLRTDAAFAAVRTVDDATHLDMTGGTTVGHGAINITVTPTPPLKIVAHRPGKVPGEKDQFDIEGELSTATRTGGYLVVHQPDESSKWLPVESIAANATGGTITLTRESGFVYDPARKRLQETYYPFRTEGGEPTVRRPVSLSASTVGGVLRVQSSHAFRVEVDGKVVATIAAEDLREEGNEVPLPGK